MDELAPIYDVKLSAVSSDLECRPIPVTAHVLRGVDLGFEARCQRTFTIISCAWLFRLVCPDLPSSVTHCILRLPGHTLDEKEPSDVSQFFFCHCWGWCVGVEWEGGSNRVSARGMLSFRRRV